ncbi:MAG: flagellar hook-associated protein FlgK [Candidatus Jordarchaeum sp.]|uniref:flagellar hook-associated protein FlgK n=1 Tax=Candidatus Jordarchaeum sp. TaxID=2823881 RepID=UPI00404B7B37
MYGIRSVLDIAKGALMAQEKNMAVTSHNLSNVNTDGYSRQKAILESNAPLPSTRIKIGMGVKIHSIVQYVDQFIIRNIYKKTSTLKEYETKSSILSQLETIFNEIEGSGMLTKAMKEFWMAWQDLSNNPGGISERTALLTKAEVLASRFNSMNRDLSQIRKELNNNLKNGINELNILSKRIAEINGKIVMIEANGTEANDLRDLRRNYLKELSELIENVYLEDENGGIKVMTSTGVMLVDGTYYWELSQDENNIYWNQIESDISKRLKGGKIGAWLDLRDDIVPEYIANLDELAGSLIREVNNLHFAGYTLLGETGKYFFENFKQPPDIPNSDDYRGASAFIKLSDDVKNNPINIAAGRVSGQQGDNENALRILTIQTENIEIKKWRYEERGYSVSSSVNIETLDNYYHTLVGEIGVKSNEYDENKNFSQALLNNLNETRDSISGVNLDEEMIELIKIQRAHEAASKLVAIADEMLRTLLDMR